MLEKYFSMLKEGGADLAIRIDVKTIKTAAWTVYKCKYGCSAYGQSCCCPPNSPSWKDTQEIIDCFQYGILFRCHEMNLVTPLAVKLSRELVLDDYYKAVAFGSGPCRKCAECNTEHCNFPGQAVPAMEACGIDVFTTVRNNGIDLHMTRDKDAVQNYFGLLLVE